MNEEPGHHDVRCLAVLWAERPLAIDWSVVDLRARFSNQR